MVEFLGFGFMPGMLVQGAGLATPRSWLADRCGYKPSGADAGYARKFIEDAKSEGLVKSAAEKAGVRGAVQE